MLLYSIELVSNLGCECWKGSIDCLTFVVSLNWEVTSPDHLARVASGHCPHDSVIDGVRVSRDSAGDAGCGTVIRDWSGVNVRHAADVVIPDFDDERAVLALGIVLCILSVFSDDGDGLNGCAVRKFSGGEFFCQHLRVGSSPS